MAAPRLTLYLDIVSPFSYIAYYVVRHSPAFSACTVNYTPILLGGLFKLCENTAPISIKNKNEWINRDRRRWAQRFNIPMVEERPEGFPVKTLPLQRILCALSVHAPDKVIPAIDALYESLWAKGNGRIAEPESFLPVLKQAIGESAAQVAFKAADEPEIKHILHANTKKAFDAGAFGVPYFEGTTSDGEVDCFFGVDSIWQVVEHLGLVETREELIQFIPPLVKD